MDSNLMFGISVVKKPSDHIGKTTMRTQMEWFSLWTPATRKGLTSALKNSMPSWVRKHLLKSHSLFTPISKISNLLSRLKRSLMLSNCRRSRTEPGTFKLAPPSPKKVSRKAWSGSSSPFQTKSDYQIHRIFNAIMSKRSVTKSRITNLHPSFF